MFDTEELIQAVNRLKRRIDHLENRVLDLEDAVWEEVSDDEENTED